MGNKELSVFSDEELLKELERRYVNVKVTNDVSNCGKCNTSPEVTYVNSGYQFLCPECKNHAWQFASRYSEFDKLEAIKFWNKNQED